MPGRRPRKVWGAAVAAALVVAGLGHGQEYEPGSTYRSEDSNADGVVDLADAVQILGFLLLGLDPPRCSYAADADCNGQHQLTDAVRILGYAYLGGSPLIPTPCPGTTRVDPIPACSAVLGPCDYSPDLCGGQTTLRPARPALRLAFKPETDVVEGPVDFTVWVDVSNASADLAANPIRGEVGAQPCCGLHAHRCHDVGDNCA